jgi:hypothetical protein
MSDTENTESKKATFIVSSEHALISRSAGESIQVAPGERVPFDEEADSHKYLRTQIEAGDPAYAYLSIQEVDLKAEQSAEEEREEQLEQAEKIAAEQREEEARAFLDQEGEESDQVEGDTPPVPQLAEAQLAPQDKESVRLAKKSGAGQRASTQDDVAEGDKPRSRSRSRSAGEE